MFTLSRRPNPKTHSRVKVNHSDRRTGSNQTRSFEFTDVLLPVFQKNSQSESHIWHGANLLSKKAVVKPLIKRPNTDPEVLANYRLPVSGKLPYLSKILERAVADQMQANLDTDGLHVKFQSAYRRRHSTETALLRILNDLLVMTDGGNNAVLVLLDLTAAFGHS